MVTKRKTRKQRGGNLSKEDQDAFMEARKLIYNWEWQTVWDDEKMQKEKNHFENLLKEHPNIINYIQDRTGSSLVSSALSSLRSKDATINHFIPLDILIEHGVNLAQNGLLNTINDLISVKKDKVPNIFYDKLVDVKEKIEKAIQEETDLKEFGRSVKRAQPDKDEDEDLDDEDTESVYTDTTKGGKSSNITYRMVSNRKTRKQRGGNLSKEEDDAFEFSLFIILNWQVKRKQELQEYLNNYPKIINHVKDRFTYLVRSAISILRYSSFGMNNFIPIDMLIEKGAHLTKYNLRSDDIQPIGIINNVIEIVKTKSPSPEYMSRLHELKNKIDKTIQEEKDLEDFKSGIKRAQPDIDYGNDENDDDDDDDDDDTETVYTDTTKGGKSSNITYKMVSNRKTRKNRRGGGFPSIELPKMDTETGFSILQPAKMNYPEKKYKHPITSGPPSKEMLNDMLKKYKKGGKRNTRKNKIVENICDTRVSMMTYGPVYRLLPKPVKKTVKRIAKRDCMRKMTFMK